MPSATSCDASFKSTDPVIVIVGTKIDLYAGNKMNQNELQQYKDALLTIRKSWKHPYIACSAKRGYQVDKVFSTAVNAVLVARGLRKKTKNR